jgi:excinuclease UvrABC ATPase subunit
MLPGVGVHPARNELEVVADLSYRQGQGGDRGGEIVAQGTPEQVAQAEGSYT